jgi:hypothetical protein
VPEKNKNDTTRAQHRAKSCARRCRGLFFGSETRAAGNYKRECPSRRVTTWPRHSSLRCCATSTSSRPIVPCWNWVAPPDAHTLTPPAKHGGQSLCIGWHQQPCGRFPSGYDGGATCLGLGIGVNTPGGSGGAHARDHVERASTSAVCNRQQLLAFATVGKRRCDDGLKAGESERAEENTDFSAAGEEDGMSVRLGVLSA